MPAIASLEDLKTGQKDLRHEVLEVTTCHLRLTTYGKWEMAENGLEKHLQALA